VSRKRADVETEGQGQGRLVALDGTRGADVRRSAAALSRELGSRKAPAGASWWDASGIFFEMGLGKKKHRAASPRTLMLLYAADLAFRLRWEIRPAIAAGQTVIAAPYLDAAFAFGRATGLSIDWMTALFRFAPKPDACYRAPERKKSEGWKKDRRDGLGECFGAVLADGDASFRPEDLRREMLAHLESPGRGRKCRRLT
jgi:hypothetical protein